MRMGRRWWWWGSQPSRFCGLCQRSVSAVARRVLLTAGALNVAGALGLELAEGWVDASTADRNGLVVLITTEEAMGIPGVLLMLSTLLASLHSRLPAVLVNPGFDHGRLIRWKGTTVLSFTRQSDSLSLGSAARSACESCGLIWHRKKPS